jgi:hypothetical protein
MSKSKMHSIVAKQESLVCGTYIIRQKMTTILRRQTLDGMLVLLATI